MTIKVELPEVYVEITIERLEERVIAMTNTLNSFRSNNLTHTDAYKELQMERDGLQSDKKRFERLLEEARQEAEEEADEAGLGELFG